MLINFVVIAIVPSIMGKLSANLNSEGGNALEVWQPLKQLLKMIADVAMERHLLF